MISVEQWRASIGLNHSGSHRQLACTSDERQLAPIPIYHLIVITVLVLILLGMIPFIIRILVNGYSLLKRGLTRVMAHKKRSTQLSQSTQCEVDPQIVSKYLIDLSKDDLESLGQALGLYQRTMMNYAPGTLFQFRQNLIRDWINGKDKVKGSGGATWSSLVNALRDEQVRENGIAAKIETEQIKAGKKKADGDHSPSPPPTKQIEHSPPPPTKQIQRSPPPPPVTDSPPQSPFQFFVSFLRSFYDSEIPLSYCKWPPVPKKTYINLAAISREKVTDTELKKLKFMLATLRGDVDQILETKSPIQLQDILEAEKGETLHCVLVEGAPGVGKTTLSWQICKCWGRRELFQQYAVVMLLRLRDRTVQNAKTIMDLVYYMYDDEDEDSRTNISQHLKQTKGKHTLVILEGLDELPKHLLNTDQPSIFTRLLSRKVLPNATILVTSRPSATAQLRKGSAWEISRHIEVLGFTDVDITDYVRNALSVQELPAFDNYLSTYPNIRLAMYIPLNCAIVVQVYRSCQQSGCPPPTTATELYTRLVQTILTRYLDSHPQYKLKNDKTDIEQFTDLLPPVSDHFYKLTEKAYDGVLNQQLTFEDQYIEHLGFLDSVTELFSIKRAVTYSYNFLHLSLQEYLAAYHVSLKSMDVQQQLLKSICAKTHLRNMGRFLAGITKYQGMDRDTVKAIIEQQCEKRVDGELTLSTYTLQLLHESGDYSIIDGYSSYYCELTDYSPLLDFAVSAHCIAKSSYKWTLALGGLSQHMQSTDRIAMFVQTLNNHSNPSYTIERIECHYDAPECVQHLLLELPQHALQHIQTLWLRSNRANPQPLPLPVLEHILSKMSRLHRLWLWWGAVSTTGAVAMAELIKNNNTLRDVLLYHNAIGAEGVEALKKIREIKKDLKLDILQW